MVYILSSDDFQVWMMRILAAITQHLEYISKSNDPDLSKEIAANMSINNSKRYGKYEFPSSQKYIGWWADGKVRKFEIFLLFFLNLIFCFGLKFDGIGSSEFMGNYYEGSWRLHDRSGQGLMKFANGDEYNGEWAYDKQDGYGILTCSNGDQYRGNWKAGKKNGRVSIINSIPSYIKFLFLKIDLEMMSFCHQFYKIFVSL